MTIAVTAFPRTLQGTSASRRLRNTGRVPGIIYGADQPVQKIELDQAAVLRHLKLEVFHASVLDVTVDGVTTQALLRDFQMHPFKPIALHVDFQRVDKNKKIHMKVPLHFVNADICVGVKTGGGVVQHIINEMEILCLPADLPEFIEVDVTNLQVAHSMHVNDLVFPKGVEPIPRWKKENPGVATVQMVDDRAGNSYLFVTGIDAENVVLTGGQAVRTSGGFTYEFGGRIEASGVSVRRDPGDTFIWLAVGMAVIGLAITFYVPRRRLWVKVTDSRTYLAGVAERTTRFGRELRFMGVALGARDALRPGDLEEP